eukprot:TRINITY_DN7459_c0_g1_i1.p1 TRINITY_DN7459_c0_g1~~TRINITY_DN7459_c0_g1_i1.p1  ORF type:complete len:172 (+),score=44.92 TRINITY_DN7459_c0_g1_i1:201-716(+)
MGVDLVAVGNGNTLFAKGFKEGIPFEGEVLIDETSTVFQKASLPRLSVWQTLKRFLMNLSLLSLYSSLGNDYPNSNLNGDGQQTGAVYVLGPGKDSKILYSFRENDNDPETFADIDAILEAVNSDGYVDRYQVEHPPEITHNNDNDDNSEEENKIEEENEVSDDNNNNNNN